MNLSVDFLTGAILAIVTGCSKDCDPGINQATHHLANWVILIGIGGQRAEAHVDYANIIDCTIGQHPIQRIEQTRDRAYALLIQNSKVDEIGIRSDADELTVGDAAITGSRRGDVRAMTVRIICSVLASEIFVDNNSVLLPGTQEGFMSGINAGIYDSDADARTV